MNLQMEKSDAVFSTTLWTVLSGLRDSDAERHRKLLEELISRYWPPVYGYLRRTGHDREHAAELTQGFFADVVVQRDLFDRADQSQGRLRSLLLTALKNYLRDQHRRGASRGDTQKVSLDSVAHIESSLKDQDDPERTFDRAWALTVLNQAVARTERHFTSTGKAGHWKVFEARLLHPAASGCEPPPLSMLAERYAFKSPADAAAAVQVVKKRFDALLREVIAETTMNVDESQQELADLLSLLA